VPEKVEEVGEVSMMNGPEQTEEETVAKAPLKKNLQPIFIQTQRVFFWSLGQEGWQLAKYRPDEFLNIVTRMVLLSLESQSWSRIFFHLEKLSIKVDCPLASSFVAARLFFSRKSIL